MAYGYVKDGTCGSCANYTYEGNNSKGYCSYYGTYYWPDDSCSHWKSSGSSGSGGCFITSACCSYKGLPDDCYELETLRKFRDTYLKEQSYGRDLIEIYYRDAPKFVDMINESPDRDEIYEKLYKKVQEIVALVEKKKYETAIIEYLFMVYQLKCKENK